MRAWRPSRLEPQRQVQRKAQRHVRARASPPGAARSVGRRTLLGGLAPILCCGCPCCSRAAGKKQRLQWYDKYFATAMHTSMGTYETAIAPVKEHLFSRLLAPGALATDGSRDSSSSSSSDFGRGLRLLDVGIGTGPNLTYMANALGPERLPSLHITGLDPNPEMQPYCQQAAARAGLAEGQLSLVEGSAEEMPFEDGSFDAAVITLVLCSVPSPAAALSEVRRVVAPGGRLAIIEHVAAPVSSKPLVALGQKLLDPLQQLVADGCHLTRDTGRVLRQVGYDTSQLDSFEVEGLGILAPHIAGIVQL